MVWRTGMGRAHNFSVHRKVLTVRDLMMLFALFASEMISNVRTKRSIRHPTQQYSHTASLESFHVDWVAVWQAYMLRLYT